MEQLTDVSQLAQALKPLIQQIVQEALASYVPPSQPSETDLKFRFLESKGWKNQGQNAKGDTLWADPRGSNEPGKTKVSVTVPHPKQKGQTISYEQLSFPPCVWDYPTGEALQIQQERDEYEAKQKVA